MALPGLPAEAEALVEAFKSRRTGAGHASTNGFTDERILYGYIMNLTADAYTRAAGESTDPDLKDLYHMTRGAKGQEKLGDGPGFDQQLRTNQAALEKAMMDMLRHRFQDEDKAERAFERIKETVLSRLYVKGVKGKPTSEPLASLLDGDQEIGAIADSIFTELSDEKYKPFFADSGLNTEYLRTEEAEKARKTLERDEIRRSVMTGMHQGFFFIQMPQVEFKPETFKENSTILINKLAERGLVAGPSTLNGFDAMFAKPGGGVDMASYMQVQGAMRAIVIDQLVTFNARKAINVTVHGMAEGSSELVNRFLRTTDKISMESWEKFKDSIGEVPADMKIGFGELMEKVKYRTGRFEVSRLAMEFDEAFANPMVTEYLNGMEVSKETLTKALKEEGERRVAAGMPAMTDDQITAMVEFFTDPKRGGQRPPGVAEHLDNFKPGDITVKRLMAYYDGVNPDGTIRTRAQWNGRPGLTSFSLMDSGGTSNNTAYRQVGYSDELFKYTLWGSMDPNGLELSKLFKVTKGPHEGKTFYQAHNSATIEAAIAQSQRESQHVRWGYTGPAYAGKGNPRLIGWGKRDHYKAAGATEEEPKDRPRLAERDDDPVDLSSLPRGIRGIKAVISF